MEYEIIGTRPNSAFRVPIDYFLRHNDRFRPMIDPTTGGPCAVVEADTDDVIDPRRVSYVRDSRDPNCGRVTILDQVPAPTEPVPNDAL